MAKQRHDSPTTRRELIESGRALFSEVGYALAGTEAIVANARLTRGALYHHFGNKEGLFAAVLEQVHAELAAEVDQRARRTRGGALDALNEGFQAWLDVALRDDVRRILLVDGPAVVGWECWHEMDRQHGFGVTRATLARAMQAGEMDELPVDELTHVLLGAVTQAGLALSRSDDPSAARVRYQHVIDALLRNMPGRTDKNLAPALARTSRQPS